MGLKNLLRRPRPTPAEDRDGCTRLRGLDHLIAWYQEQPIGLVDLDEYLDEFPDEGLMMGFLL